MEDIVIRRERPEDYEEVERITRDAFWNLHVPGCSEHYLAHILRRHEDFIPELDLVAERNGSIVGSIMYTKAWLVDETGNQKEILTFGPISVAPEAQRQGIGKRLMARSFRLAADMGYDAVVIFGHPGNYVSSGFQSCLRYHVMLEGGIYPTAMLVRELRENAFDGRNWYYRESSAFQFDIREAEEFDRQFPPREKAYLPCQEEFYIYSHSTARE